MADETTPTFDGPGRRLSSRQLADLIVDALFDIGIIAESDMDRATEIVEIEINARKSMGDY